MCRRRLFPLAIAIVLVWLAAAPAGACITNTGQYNFSDTFRSSLIGDFNDYALILEDAKTPECSAYAREALIRKISTTGWHWDGHFPPRWVGPFQGWLEGNQVALIYAAALMIGGNGDLNTPLNDRLIGRGGPIDYAYNPGNGCGWRIEGWRSRGDTCMEEHAAAAAGYAWIAAYVAKRNGSWYANAYASYSRWHIAEALSTGDSICINDPNEPTDPYGRGPCNVDVSGLDPQSKMDVLTAKLTPDANGRTVADVLSFNRGENITYGAGQLTIIGAALIGLEEAQQPAYLGDDAQLIAWALIDEAQRKSTSDGSWFKGDGGSAPTCADVTVVNNNAAFRSNDSTNCADNNVRPKIYNLNARRSVNNPYTSFAERYVNSRVPRTTVVDHYMADGQLIYAPPQTAFPFNEFNDALFSNDANEQNLGPGRRVLYGTLGYRWHTIDPQRYNENQPWSPMTDYRPRLTAYLDDNEPYGWLNGITDYGSLGAAVYGWACDRDRPDFAVKVEIVVDGMVVGSGWAYYSSESQVNYECGGGTAHRYAIAIPAWTKGHWVQAYGLDATWKGRTLLAAYNCGQLYACTW